MYTTLILSAIILLLVVERVLTQRHHVKVVDRLTDKILARNYTDFEVGQALKHDTLRDLAMPARSDEVEAQIEKDNIKRTEENLKNLGGQIAAAVGVHQ